MNKHLRTALGITLIAAAAACNRNNDDVAPAPKIDAGKSSDTLQVGQTIRLSPTVSQANLRYQWKVNDVPSGAGATYEFEAREHGNYRITFIASNGQAADSAVYQLKVLGAYENGFYILNEGWFGTETGSVFYYPYGADTVQPRVYTKENPGKDLGTITNTLQYGAIHNGKLYMVVKAGGPLVVTDAVTLKETGRISNVADGGGMAFAGVDATRGLISASDGIYPLNLSTVTLGARISGTSGTYGNMLKAGNYIFAHSAANGGQAVVLDAATYAIVKTATKATIGFVQAKTNDVYCVRDSFLMRIDPATLAVDSVKMKFRAVAPWGAWRSVSMAASTQTNTVYIVQPGTGWTYGTKLYRYQIGSPASLDNPFITLPSGQYFYGAGVAYDKHANELVITTINGPFSGSVNRVLFYDAETGALKKTVPYNGWYFPAMVVIQP